MAEFAYRPGACDRDYRVVVVRKNLSVAKGEQVLFDDIRYFFYITNRPEPADQIVMRANQRCNQENLIEQLKNGVQALRMPVGRSDQQLGLHGDGVVGLDAEGVVCVAAARNRTLGPEISG